MKPTQKTAAESLPERSGVRAEEIHAAREVWMNRPPMRRVLEAELARCTEELRNRLESCAPEELPGIQGEIRGLRRALGLIADQKN